MRSTPSRILIGPLILGVIVFGVVAATAQHIFTGTGNWNETARWSSGMIPGHGAEVIIDGVVTLTNSTANLASYTLESGRTHTFSGTNTALRATTVTINGVMTHPVQDSTSDPWPSSHRIWIVCKDLTLTGLIDVDKKGYRGAEGPGRPEGDNMTYLGGSHGGLGGQGRWRRTLGPVYGDADAPVWPGSGGRNGDGGGGAGGGIVRIEAGGHVAINGVIQADGDHNPPGAHPGTGAGGSIYITCRTVGGMGRLTASGGKGGAYGGCGGGGRIAIHYDTALQAALNETAFPTVILAANQGMQRELYANTSRPGSLWLSDSGFFPGTLIQGGVIIIPGVTSFRLPSLTVTNGIAVFPTGATLEIDGNLTLTPHVWSSDYYRECGLELRRGDVTIGTNLMVNGGQFRLWGNPDTSNTVTHLTVSGDCVVTHGGYLHVTSGPTNAVAPEYGLRVDIVGDLRVDSNSWVRSYSDPFNGGSPFFTIGSITVASGGGISANAGGYYGKHDGDNARGYGPGAGYYCYGGSHGGLGGKGRFPGNTWATYGDSNAPVHAGSTGGAYGNTPGGRGGGVVRIECHGPLHLYGALSADGDDLNGHGGNGAGGSVYVRCHTIYGNGALSARGGSVSTSYGGPGGGGRIAIWSIYNRFEGTALAEPGTGPYTPPEAQPGSIVWGQIIPPRGILIIAR